MDQPKTSLVYRNARVIATVGCLIASFAAAQPLQVTVSPAEITGGTGSINVQVKLWRPVPTGTTVTLVSSVPAVASAPSSVLIPQGASSFTYTVSTAAVASDTSVQISAQVANFAVPTVATFRVLAPVLVRFYISPDRVVGGPPPFSPTGFSVPVFPRGYVTLSGPAPEGMTVELASSDPAAPVPSPEPVRAKERTLVFPILTRTVSASTVAEISVRLGTKKMSWRLVILPR